MNNKFAKYKSTTNVKLARVYLLLGRIYQERSGQAKEILSSTKILKNSDFP